MSINTHFRDDARYMYFFLLKYTPCMLVMTSTRAQLAFNMSDDHLRHWQRKLPRKPIVQFPFARRLPRVVPRSCGTIHCACPSLLPRWLNPVEQLSQPTKKKEKQK